MLSALPHNILKRVSGHFMSPAELLDTVGLKPGQTVLELGSPVGFFAAAALHHVGQSGQVYVAGPTSESLERFEHYSDVPNFHTALLSGVLAGKVAPDGVDVVILTNLISNTMSPGEYCLSINQYLKPGGQVVLIDWDPQQTGQAVGNEQSVSREDAIKIVTGCGLEFDRVLETPGYHYGLVFRFATPHANLETA